MFFDKTLLAIFAHPDDESFIVGGTLALAAKKTNVKIIVATRGEKGRSHIGYEISDADLAAVRKKELEAALEALGIIGCIVLDYPDGHLDEAGEEEIVEKLVSIMKDFHPAGVLTFGPDGVTGHRDHIAIGKFATKAAAIAGIDVYWAARPQSLMNLISRNWIRTKKFYREIPAVPYSEEDLIRIDVSETIEEKRKAIAAHASQEPERYAVPEAEELIRYEYFYKVPEK